MLGGKDSGGDDCTVGPQLPGLGVMEWGGSLVTQIQGASQGCTAPFFVDYFQAAP